MIQVRFGPKTYSNYNCSIWLERLDLHARHVMDCDAQDLGAAISEAMVDVRNVVLNLLWSMVQVLRMELSVACQIPGIFFSHRRKILHNNEIRLSDGADIAVIEPDGAVAERFDVSGGVRNE